MIKENNLVERIKAILDKEFDNYTNAMIAIEDVYDEHQMLKYYNYYISQLEELEKLLSLHKDYVRDLSPVVLS